MITNQANNALIRKSNFELLRIVSMLLVLLIHAYGVALGMPTKNDFALLPLSATGRVLINSFSIICVDVFVLLSGWFGINPKWKSFLGFVFQCFFFSIIVSVVASLLGVGGPITVRDVGNMFFFGKYYYWFVKCYLCLYVLSPVLNAFVQTADKKTFLIVLIGFFILQTIYGWTGSMADFDRGFSVISFVGLYLLARYIKVYGGAMFRLNKWLDIAIYSSLCLVVAACYLIAVAVGKEGITSFLFLSINPISIIASVFFLLFFSKMNFKSKTINYLSRSAFAVYLFHLNAKIWDGFLDTCYTLFTNNNGIKAFLLVFGFLIIVFITAILIDQVRLLCWNPIKKKFQ